MQLSLFFMVNLRLSDRIQDEPRPTKRIFVFKMLLRILLTLSLFSSVKWYALQNLGDRQRHLMTPTSSRPKSQATPQGHWQTAATNPPQCCVSMCSHWLHGPLWGSLAIVSLLLAFSFTSNCVGMFCVGAVYYMSKIRRSILKNCFSDSYCVMTLAAVWPWQCWAFNRSK